MNTFYNLFNYKIIVITFFHVASIARNRSDRLFNRWKVAKTTLVWMAKGSRIVSKRCEEKHICLEKEDFD
jgi:hypothetical protein